MLVPVHAFDADREAGPASFESRSVASQEEKSLQVVGRDVLRDAFHRVMLGVDRDGHELQVFAHVRWHSRCAAAIDWSVSGQTSGQEVWANVTTVIRPVSSSRRTGCPRWLVRVKLGAGRPSSSSAQASAC